MKTAMQQVVVLGRAVLLAAVAIAMLPAIASAQQSNECGMNCIFEKYQTFLRMDGIYGGSQDPEHRGWMDVLSLRQTYLRFPKTGPFNGNCEIQIVKPLDRAGPKLWVAGVLGEHFPRATIEIIAWTSAMQQWKLYSIDLHEVTIKSIVTTEGSGETGGESSGGMTVADTLTIDARSIHLTYYQPGGGNVESEFICN